MLTDFCISQQQSLAFSTALNYKMTPAYASIEQIRQQKAEPYFDMWALGVTIYRMIAGKVPEFKGNKFNPLPTNFSKELRDLVD